MNWNKFSQTVPHQLDEVLTYWLIICKWLIFIPEVDGNALLWSQVGRGEQLGVVAKWQTSECEVLGSNHGHITFCFSCVLQQRKKPISCMSCTGGTCFSRPCHGQEYWVAITPSPTLWFPRLGRLELPSALLWAFSLALPLSLWLYIYCIEFRVVKLNVRCQIFKYFTLPTPICFSSQSDFYF
jgi:hypothetical protein